MADPDCLGRLFRVQPGDGDRGGDEILEAVKREDKFLLFHRSGKGLLRAPGGEDGLAAGPSGRDHRKNSFHLKNHLKIAKRTFFCNNIKMPRNIRDLVKDLENAGFINRGGKGNHRNFTHPALKKPITISGNLGEDAKHYQDKAVLSAIKEVQK